MNTAAESRADRRIVLVVGVDLSDVSKHLLDTVMELVRSAPEAELHVAHVVAPEPISLRVGEPSGAIGVADRAHVEGAQWELQRLCVETARAANVRVVVHTPVGEVAHELLRIAADVDADIVVIEAHKHDGWRWALHRSVAARLARSAPCSVLAIRPHGFTASGPLPATAASTSHS